jgi:hypothetical protein
VAKDNLIKGKRAIMKTDQYDDDVLEMASVRCRIRKVNAKEKDIQMKMDNIKVVSSDDHRNGQKKQNRDLDAQEDKRSKLRSE